MFDLFDLDNEGFITGIGFIAKANELQDLIMK
jgi:hypothetical protein